MLSGNHDKEAIRNGTHTPFTIAVCSKDYRLVQKLLDEKVDMNWHFGAFGNSALHWSVANSNNKMSLFLLNKAPTLNVNILDLFGKTALHLAIGKGWNHFDDSTIDADDIPQAPVIYQLIRKTNLNLPDQDGNTPLHIAMMRRDTEVIKDLLANGASLEIQNKLGKKPAAMLNLNFEEVQAHLQNYTATAFTLTRANWEKNKEEIEKFIRTEQKQAPRETTHLIQTSLSHHLKKKAEIKPILNALLEKKEVETLEPSNDITTSLFQRLKEHKLLNSHVESTIATLKTSPEDRVKVIEKLQNIAYRLEILQEKAGPETQIEKAFKILFNLGCMNLQIYQKLTDHVIPSPRGTAALALTIARGIHSLNEMGLLESLNDSHYQAICKLTDPNQVESMFIQVTEHIMQHRTSARLSS